MSSVFWRNVAIHYADAAGVARRPAGILKDGSVLVGADHEEGVERRSGKEHRVRREFYAGLADQSGGKREVGVVAAGCGADGGNGRGVCARARARLSHRYPVSDQRVSPVIRPSDHRPSRSSTRHARRRASRAPNPNVRRGRAWPMTSPDAASDAHLVVFLRDSCVYLPTDKISR